MPSRPTSALRGIRPKEAAGELAGGPVSEQDIAHMREALRLMRQAGVVDKTGGPFGAVVVRDGEVLAAAGNSVVRDSDPSAHAEVNAIRAACRKAGSPNIPGAVLYSSCEPCPMCYSIAYWARIDKIFYAASWADYADLFDDSNIGRDLAQPYPRAAGRSAADPAQRRREGLAGVSQAAGRGALLEASRQRHADEPLVADGRLVGVASLCW